MKKRKKKKIIKDITPAESARIEGDVIDAPQEDEKYVKDISTAEWLLKGWNDACAWFDTNKRAEFNYAEKVSLSQAYTDFKTMSQVVQTDTENAERALVAKDIVSIYMKKPFAKLSGVDYKDYPGAKEVDKALGVLFTKMPDFNTEMVDFLQQRRMYGTAVGKVIYRDIYRDVRIVEDGEAKVKKLLVYSGPIVQDVDVKENFRIEPAAHKLNGFWKYHRFISTYRALKNAKTKEGKPIYKNLEKVVKQSIAKNEPQANNSAPFENHEGPATPRDDDMVVGVECWTPDDSKRYVITLGAKPILIAEGCNPNPYGRHPFFSATINKPTKKFYGRGTPQVCKAKQEWLDIICNMINDVSYQNAAPMFSDPNNEYPYSNVPYEPWGVVHADLKAFNKPLLPTEVFALRNELQKGIEEDSGASRISTSMGMNSAINNMKANVYIGAKNASNERHSYDLFMLDDVGLTEMVTRCVWLLQSCMSDEVWLQMTGNPKVTISWKTLPLNLEFTATLGIDAMNKEGMQQNLMYLLTQVVPVAAKIGLSVDLMEMINMAFEVAGLDPNRFIKPGAPQGAEGQPTGEGGTEKVGEPSGAGIPVAKTVNQYRPGIGTGGQ